MTDPAPEDLTDDDLVLLWRALSAEARARLTAAIVDEIEHPKGPPKKRGPRPMSARPRWVKKRFDDFAKKRGKRSVKELWPRFYDDLRGTPELFRLLPKPTARSRNRNEPTTKAASNLLTLGGNLNRQRRDLRRLVFALREIERESLAAHGSWRAWRNAVEAGRTGRPEDLAEIKRLADEHERTLASDEWAFRRDRAARALLGDDAAEAQSFIRLPPLK